MKTFILFFTLSLSIFAGTALETDSFQTIEKKVMELGKKYGVKNVLVVFDIDNTILTMPQNFGSDQWFSWQSSHCPGKKPAPEFCVTNDFDELLDIQGQIFAISNMVPTEKATVPVIKDIQSKGYKTILLTSRGPDFRNATERALKNNGYDFTTSAIGPKKGYPGTYIPYTLKNPKAYGLSAQDMKKMGNKKARPVSYSNGVFMTSGLHKGVMLKTLLNKTNGKFKAIVFADDHKKHTERMQDIFGNMKGIDLVTFRYSKIDPVVEAFHKSDKKDAISAWNTLKKASESIFK